MDLASETTPLLVAERIIDGEVVALPTSPTCKKTSPRAQQVAALMLITTVWPFSFEMIYPFINQVRYCICSPTHRKNQLISVLSQFIMEIGVTGRPEDVGFYSGLVESIFAVVQLFTSEANSNLSMQPCS
jgi:hypothetical protein